MKRTTFLTVYAMTFTMVIVLISSSFAKTSNFLKLLSSEDQPALGKTKSSTVTSVISSTYFPVGPGEVDVIPHQIVRTNTDHLYLFAYQDGTKVLRVYRTTGTGLPTSASDFASIQITDASNILGVDAVYDGANFIHVLVNTQDRHIRDYPFNVTTNKFNASITLASNGGAVTSGLYAGTSGTAGMMDLSGHLHVVYWTSTNHILHRVYSYNSSTNVLSALTSFFQIDSAGNANHPALAISPVDNSLTVAWISQADNPVRIRTRTRASNGTWGGIQVASTASVWTSTSWGINIDQGPSLIIDSAGVKHITYIQSAYSNVDYGQIHYVTNTGSGWVDHTLNAFTHDPALAINSAGEMYIIGHGHPNNPTCLSMNDMCIIKKNSDGTWGNPQLFATPPSDTFDSSPSVKWSIVGFNRPEMIEFVFFKTPYNVTTLYYGRLQSSPSVAISGNAGVGGTTLTYTNGGPQFVMSDAGGNYSITVPMGWSGTVTPHKILFSFTPGSNSYTNIQGNVTGQNFTAQNCGSCADKDTVGVFRPSNGLLYLKNLNISGYADIAINYGKGGDYPVVGDWDGDGTATIGIYRNGSFYLRNSNTVGYADIVFPFGQAGDQPIAGDWDGDGTDTIGVYRSSTGTFYLRNSNTPGDPDVTFQLGMRGDVAIAGDWTGKGYDTTGVFRPSNGALYLKNTNTTGYADIQINYGLPGDKPVVGDWDNNGTDTIGVYRGNTFYLRNSNTIGYADLVFSLGLPGDMPIAGDWDALP